MTRTIFFALATAAAFSMNLPAWSQAAGGDGNGTSGSGAVSNAGADAGANAGAGQAAGNAGSNAAPNQSSAAGPGQTGAAKNNGAGPNQTGSAAPMSTGPNATGVGGVQGTPGQSAATGQAAAGRAPGQVGTGSPGNPLAGQAKTAAGQSQPSQFNGFAQTPWFNNPNARQQLQLNDSQFNQLIQGYGTAWNRYQQGVTGLNDNLTPHQRQQQALSLRQNFNSEFGHSLDTTFADREVRDRFNQLNLQFQGFAAFDDPAVQPQLRLTPNQQMQLELLAQSWNNDLKILGQLNSSDPAAAAQQFNQVHDQMARDINNVFTPEQRRMWSKMGGTPFTFELNDYFPGGNGQRMEPGQLNQPGQQTPANTQQVPSQSTIPPDTQDR